MGAIIGGPLRPSPFDDAGFYYPFHDGQIPPAVGVCPPTFPRQQERVVAQHPGVAQMNVEITALRRRLREAEAKLAAQPSAISSLLPLAPAVLALLAAGAEQMSDDGEDPAHREKCFKADMASEALAVAVEIMTHPDVKIDAAMLQILSGYAVRYREAMGAYRKAPEKPVESDNFLKTFATTMSDLFAKMQMEAQQRPAPPPSAPSPPVGPAYSTEPIHAPRPVGVVTPPPDSMHGRTLGGR